MSYSSNFTIICKNIVEHWKCVRDGQKICSYLERVLYTTQIFWLHCIFRAWSIYNLVVSSVSYSAVNRGVLKPAIFKYHALKNVYSLLFYNKFFLFTLYTIVILFLRNAEYVPGVGGIAHITYIKIVLHTYIYMKVMMCRAALWSKVFCSKFLLSMGDAPKRTHLNCYEQRVSYIFKYAFCNLLECLLQILKCYGLHLPERACAVWCGVVLKQFLNEKIPFLP